jgi:integrase
MWAIRLFPPRGLTAVSLLLEPGLDAAGFHPHELRHTYASLAIASCPDIKTIQNALGHKSAKQTLDQYGHLFGDRLDLLADAMDAARTSALANGRKWALALRLCHWHGSRNSSNPP